MIKVALVALCLTGITITKGQDAPNPEKRPVRVGIRAGLHLSRFSFKGLPSEFSKPSGEDAFYAGLQFDIPVSKKLSIAPELLYAYSSVQSFKSSSNISTQALCFDDLSHLLLPVLLKYKVGHVSFSAGPQAEFLLSANGVYVENNIVKNGDLKDRSYSKFGLSGVVGIEWVFKYRFGIDARYQFGLTDAKASNAASLLSENAESIKINAFQAGLFFRFGKKPSKRTTT